VQALDTDTKTALSNRLARIEGQVRGLRRLIDADADCEKVAQQMSAARKALDKTFHEMLACMIEREVAGTLKGASVENNMKHIRALLSKYG
jgi:DNA-binding FrmR family transcriptional regulator